MALWSSRAQEFTFLVLWASSRRGSRPTRTAWTISSGYDGRPGLSALNAATPVGGVWAMVDSCVRTVEAAHP